jgi:hypothetical protein
MLTNQSGHRWMLPSTNRDRTRQVAFAGYDAILSNQSRGTWRHDAVDMPLSMNFIHMFCKRSRCDGWRTNHEKHFTVHSRNVRHMKHFYMYSVLHGMFKLTDAGVLPPQLMSSYQVYYHKQHANYYIYLLCLLNNPTVNYDYFSFQIYGRNVVMAAAASATRRADPSPIRTAGSWVCNRKYNVLVPVQVPASVVPLLNKFTTQFHTQFKTPDCSWSWHTNNLH